MERPYLKVYITPKGERALRGGLLALARRLAGTGPVGVGLLLHALDALRHLLDRALGTA